ncbi:MAG: hypothetical protein BGO98_21910 [Myxococcales bacterium 68-20]|nr:MAG: hypothetical protein BGO98_21910 [Myxococcales bacterium 68-20]
MTRRRWWPSAWVGLVVAHAFPCAGYAAESRPVGVRLSETLHAECPTEPPLFERLKAQLPHAYRASPDEPAFDLGVRIELRDGLSHGTLTLLVGDFSEEREASSSSCGDVLAALTMMAAIIIGEEEAHLQAPEPPKPLRPNRAPRKKLPSGPARRGERVSWALGAGGESDGTRGRLMLARWFVQVGFPGALEPALRLGLARSTRTELTSPNGVVSTRWSEVTFASCATMHRRGALRVAPCIELAVGTLQASVNAPPPVRSFSYPWLSAGASATLAWRVVGPLSVEGSVGVRVPFIRDELFFEPDMVVHRVPLFIPFGAAGIVVDLP